MSLLIASVGDTVRAFTQAVAQLDDNVAQIRFWELLVAVACFGGYLLIRSRAIFESLRAAFPAERVSWRRVWGAYVAAYGLNGVVPAGGGSIVQLVLTRASIDGASYTAVTSALCVPALFDGVVASVLIVYALAFGAFPRPNTFGGLSSFDLAFFARHPEITIFLITASALAALIAFAVLSRRISAFWSELRVGLGILRDPRRYALRMLPAQTAGWILRGATYYYLIDAFRVGASLHAAILLLAVQVVAAAVPFTPGGLGVQQALVLVIFSSTGPTDSVAVFSVGQQIVLVASALAMGFGAILFIFRYRSFNEVLRDVRSRRAVDRAGEQTGQDQDP